MNKFYIFILAIFLGLNFCQASSTEEMKIDFNEREEESSTSSDSFQGILNDISSGDNFLKAIKEHINNNVLHCFAFNIGQGNFVVLKFNQNLMVIDCGAINVTQEKWDDFYVKNETIFNGIFNGSSIKAVVVTHPDVDHYNCLNYLFNLKISVTPGEKILDPNCIFVVGRDNEADFNLLDKKPKKAIYAVESDQRYNNANESLTNALFGSADSDGSVEIIKPVRNITVEDTNSHSLILKVTYAKHLFYLPEMQQKILLKLFMEMQKILMKIQKVFP